MRAKQSISPLEPSFELLMTTPKDQEFEEACLFTQSQYELHFKCSLNQFYPNIFCLYQDHTLLACCGFRSANKDRLFLEQYLNAPIEQIIQQEMAVDINRESIVEIGGFAAVGRDAASILMTELAGQFEVLGFTHATSTVTTPIRRCLQRLGINSSVLGKADASKIEPANQDWGNYYRLRPLVVAGAIKPVSDLMSPFTKMANNL